MTEGIPRQKIIYKSFHGDSELKEYIQTVFPDHEVGQHAQFSATPPIVIDVASFLLDNAKWMAPASLLLLGAKEYVKAISKKLGEEHASIISDLIYDKESKSFRGSFDRVKKALSISEPTVAEKVIDLLRELQNQSNSKVSLNLEIPLGDHPFHTLGTSNEIRPDDESASDKIATWILLVGPAQKALEASPEIKPALGVNIVPFEHGFELRWQDRNSQIPYAIVFDLKGNRIGDIRQETNVSGLSEEEEALKFMDSIPDESREMVVKILAAYKEHKNSQSPE